MTTERNPSRLERLLDQAVAPGPAPGPGSTLDGDLVDRILARTSPMLGQPPLIAALDEALMPPPAPAGLIQRILDATRFAHRRPMHGVLFRIGDTRIQWAHVRALAAGFVLAASVGIVIVTSSIFHDARHIADAHRELSAMARYPGPSERIDQEIEMLSLQINQVASGPILDASKLQIDQALIDLETQINSTAADGVVF
ncbi:MAG: hypothetical protein IT440_10285 [Phycisphaeraceae bacterium]|nr:hypothetical protein [Phycisphaeraceae bacterium]